MTLSGRYGRLLEHLAALRAAGQDHAEIVERPFRRPQAAGVGVQALRRLQRAERAADQRQQEEAITSRLAACSARAPRVSGASRGPPIDQADIGEGDRPTIIASTKAEAAPTPISNGGAKPFL